MNGSHPWFRRKGVRLEELSSQPLVLREQGSTTRLAFERAMAERGLSINPVLEIGSREGVWKAVEKGLGISVVADFEFVAHPNLRVLRIVDHPVRTEYRIACLRERIKSPKIKAFLEVAGALGDGSGGTTTPTTTAGAPAAATGSPTTPSRTRINLPRTRHQPCCMPCACVVHNVCI